MAKDTWEIIEDRKKALSGLYTRMDKTRDLIYMVPYTLMDWEGKKPLTKVVNVTGNKGASHIARIVSSLMETKWQTVVEGDLSGKESRTIEEFLSDNFDQTDVYLMETYGMAGLYPFLCNHICARGLIGTQWMSYMEEGQYKIHCLPLDMRWTPFVLNKWVAPITFRTKDDLEQELMGFEKISVDGGEAIFNKIKFQKAENIEVRDYWDANTHELWVDKKLAFSQKHDYGKPSFVIVLPPSGFMLRDKGYMTYESEDALYLIRQLISEMNRNLSVQQTFAFRQLYPGYEYEVEDYDSTPSREAPKTGESKKVPKGELHRVVETGDMNRASQVARADILSMIDEGAPLSPPSYNQPPAAITVATEVELLNQLQASRITGLRMFREQLSRLMIEQFKLLPEQELAIGKRGKKRHYTLNKLKDPENYSISCKQMSQNTRIEIVNEARAMAMWGRAPMKYILRDILQVEDPDGWMREMELEEARKADPVLALLDMAIRYAEQADEVDDELNEKALRLQAKILTDRGVALIKARQQPLPSGNGTEEVKVPERKSNENLLPAMLGESGSIQQKPKMVEMGEML